MSPMITAAAVFVAVLCMLAIQAFLSKRRSPLWGATIPAVLLGMALYTFLVEHIAASVGNVLVFALPFLWSLAEWYQGRQGREPGSGKQRKQKKRA